MAQSGIFDLCQRYPERRRIVNIISKTTFLKSTEYLTCTFTGIAWNQGLDGHVTFSLKVPNKK